MYVNKVNTCKCLCVKGEGCAHIHVYMYYIMERERGGHSFKRVAAKDKI